MRKLLFITVVLFSASLVHAACSVSGGAVACPSGASTSDVNTAVASATSPVTVTFATGSYSWTGGSSGIAIPTNKTITYICATAGACTVTSTTPAIFGVAFFNAGPYTNEVRISGFVFNDSSAGFTIWWCGDGGCSGTWTQIRVDHNTFNLSAGGVAVFFGENTSVGAYYYGVLDHNTVASAGSVQLTQMIGAVDPSPPVVSPLGTANNMFLENNTITITTTTDAGDGCIDGWASNNIVARYNTSLNCLWTSHGVTHGGGPQNIEFYNNSASVNSGGVSQGIGDGYRLFHHQGSGEFIAFNNSFTA